MESTGKQRSSTPYQVVLRGVRGSIPTPGPATLGYGGHTCCVEVALAPERRLLLDCGSGLLSLGADLAESRPPRLEFQVFLTHYHYDHLAGLPFFWPLFDRGSRFAFHGFETEGVGVREAIGGVLRPPWLPVSFEDTPADKSFVSLDGNARRIDDLRIVPARLRHPQQVTAYRLEHGERAIVFATDVERGDAESDERLHELCKGADVLIHDAQYTPEEYESRRGWGHSTWRGAIEAAREAGVPRLILFHHDPDRSDDQLDALVARARRDFSGVEAARQGLALEL